MKQGPNRNLNPGMFSSDTCEWSTPQELFNELDRVFNFTLDPCASPENAKCRNFYTIEDNGLERDWGGHRVFMNPPYGREVPKWVKKAHDEAYHALTVALLPARTDTKWWHLYCENRFYVLLKGRVNFSRRRYIIPGSRASESLDVVCVGVQTGKGSAPFPSAIVLFADIPTTP